MKPSEDSELLEMIRATGEIYSRTVSLAAATMFLADLENYQPEQVKAAMARCRKELRTFPTVAEVIARIDDGHPGVEEAWAMLPKSESDSVVWTQEMSDAFYVCRGLMDKDPVAARMAFKESYAKQLAQSRALGKRADWFASLGLDKHGREAALRDAVARRRLTVAQVQKVLPELEWAPQKQTPELVANREKIMALIQRKEQS